MPLPDLLLGTRRLRRDINAQAQQLERDVAHLQAATAQLRHSAAASLSSPPVLLGAVGAGFLVGRIAARRSPAKQTRQHALGDMAAYIWHTARSMGLQVLLPIAAGWLQSKLSHGENDAANSDAAAPPANG